MSSATASSNPVQPDGFFTRSLGDADPAIAAGVAHELQRQQDQIELIASENIVSQAVLEAQGSIFTNKYARSEEHTSELQSLMRISYAVFCLKKKTKKQRKTTYK